MVTKRKDCGWASRAMLGVLLVLPALLPAQEAGWVTDELQLDLRAGPGNQYRILQMVPAGEALTVLEASEAWSRVELASGREGWMLSRFLSDQPGARERLEALDSRAQRLTLDNQRLREDLEAATGRLEALQAEFVVVNEQRNLLEMQMVEARQGLELFGEHQDMRKQLVDLQRLNEDLGHQIDLLEQRNESRWFIAGGLVLGAGLVFGLLLGRSAGRRRPRWSSEL